MKKLLRDIIAHAIGLYTATTLFSGIVIDGGIVSFAIGSAFLTLGDYILRPLLSIIAIPLQFATLGLFSFVIHAIILLVVARIYSHIKISPFHFNGIIILGIHIPAFDANIFLSYILISATIYFISRIFLWLCND